jgi:hypothetical protein
MPMPLHAVTELTFKLHAIATEPIHTAAAGVEQGRICHLAVSLLQEGLGIGHVLPDRAGLPGKVGA